MGSRPVATVGALAVACLVLGGCVSAKHAAGAGDPQRNADAKHATLTISTNAISGGKNAQEADWITKELIPAFEKAEKAKGRNVTVNYQANGIDDAKYGEKLELSLKAGGGPDLFVVGGDSIATYAAAGYIAPLDKVVGGEANSWTGWKQVDAAVKKNVSMNGRYYAVPNGVDGRVLYYNKKLFVKAGLPADWQPTSWADILAAGRKLATLSGVTPIQINAGTPMAEATTMQGFLPLLAGAGAEIYDAKAKKYQGDTKAVRDVLSFYRTLYRGAKLGDPRLQQDPNGRDESFTEFSQGKLGIIGESDYLWRSVVCPTKSVCNATAMPDRNSTVGYAMIPAERPGSGVGGQDFVSMSGGGGFTINPHTKYPQQAWDLLTFMRSATQIKAQLGSTVQITANKQVNDEILARDPALKFIADKVIPITRFRPSEEHYTSVGALIEEATGQVVAGKPVDEVAKAYQQGVVKLVGADHVSSN
ncbi:ABC transporter substrate-binding protein [Actinocatenispora rupis]|uniref:Sugar ABC transporter substrate-binding protein n=1 Tax=Actinocatenispora rupis TaxID=519421 RepID=A0A8J3JG60_9ACTN|nr:extracellular solute-binding protein [Actinocatenispora rupis]GID15792.1 sugar ABC transporter substrate-binding protein [Actinocatenispora rupis]